MTGPLAGLHALVTGAGRGIGAAIVEVADTVRWLCLRSTGSVTGQSIAVAGGEVM
jgi:hypothetical protein